MEAVERKGAGKLIRAGKVSADHICKAVEEILSNPAYSEKARHLQSSIRKLDPGRELEKIIESVVPIAEPKPSQKRIWERSTEAPAFVLT